jgi:hypothetical protein
MIGDCDRCGCESKVFKMGIEVVVSLIRRLRSPRGKQGKLGSSGRRNDRWRVIPAQSDGG